MGERYDMNYVYYPSEKNWHGAAHYYEYPCVFIWNLIAGYAGVRFGLQADLEIEPMLAGDGRVRLENPQYAIEYDALPIPPTPSTTAFRMRVAAGTSPAG